MTFRLRLRIREKETHRTWLAFWPWTGSPAIALCAKTGSLRLITHRAGYTEYNDRGEPVLYSWREPDALGRFA